MNLAHVDQIAKAVLYEGYLLYPYRPSSVKNRQRFNFGVLYPQRGGAQENEPSSMRVECLVSGHGGTRLEVRLRFLHLEVRSKQFDSSEPTGGLNEGWQEAEERDVSLPMSPLKQLVLEPLQHRFTCASQTEVSAGAKDGRVFRRQEEIHGTVDVAASGVGDDLFKLSIIVQNITPQTTTPAREEALLRSFVSTHVILGVEAGEFISLLEPPASLQDLAAECHNVGVWPVLVGEPGRRDTLLASPIILYEYPQIAPESAGDLFDGTEIDEILSLRILTLTEEEKREIRESDERAREILERVETMPEEQFMKMHGAVRSVRPLREDA